LDNIALLIKKSFHQFEMQEFSSRFKQIKALLSTGKNKGATRINTFILTFLTKTIEKKS